MNKLSIEEAVELTNNKKFFNNQFAQPSDNVDYAPNLQDPDAVESQPPGGGAAAMPLRVESFGKQVYIYLLEKTQGHLFLVVLVVVYFLAAMADTALIYGMPFFEKVPEEFACLSKDGKGGWKPCTVEHICSENLDKDSYKPVQENSEFFYNWVQQLDLLCVSDTSVSLLGSSYFVGAVVTMIIVPLISDR